MPTQTTLKRISSWTVYWKDRHLQKVSFPSLICGSFSCGRVWLQPSASMRGTVKAQQHLRSPYKVVLQILKWDLTSQASVIFLLEEKPSPSTLPGFWLEHSVHQRCFVIRLYFQDARINRLLSYARQRVIGGSNSGGQVGYSLPRQSQWPRSQSSVDASNVCWNWGVCGFLLENQPRGGKFQFNGLSDLFSEKVGKVGMVLNIL